MYIDKVIICVYHIHLERNKNLRTEQAIANILTRIDNIHLLFEVFFSTGRQGCWSTTVYCTGACFKYINK